MLQPGEHVFRLAQWFDTEQGSPTQGCLVSSPPTAMEGQGQSLPPSAELSQLTTGPVGHWNPAMHGRLVRDRVLLGASDSSPTALGLQISYQ